MSDSIEKCRIASRIFWFATFTKSSGNATRHGARPRSRRYSIAIASSPIHAASMSDIEPWTMRLSPPGTVPGPRVFDQQGA